MNETLYWLWLAHVVGPGGARCGPLLELYGSAAEVFAAVGREDLSGLLAPGQRERLRAKPGDFASLLAGCERSNVRVLTFAERDYPARLRTIPDPPPVLFCTGDASALSAARTVGMIGSRRPSAYGVEAAVKIGGELAAAGVCLVSGLADGLDSEAHRAAVAAGRPTVGVLGTAIDKTYPAANRPLRRQVEAVGAVISEYGPGEGTVRGSFLLRNRLIAALSDALCVVEAREKSGTMNTVGHAERYKKPVFAVPGGIFSQVCAGTNRLLAEGRAHLAAGGGEILAALGETPPRQKKTGKAPPARGPAVALSGPAAALAGQLSARPKPIEELAAAAGLDAAGALAALLELELAGLAEACAGGRYKRG